MIQVGSLVAGAAARMLLAAYATTATPSTLTFSGGDGSSQDKAIVIQGASGELEGVAAEYAWAGKKHPTWHLTSQALIHANGRAFDRMEYQASVGPHQIWFDITGFLGK